jgi:hypothetical protein
MFWANLTPFSLKHPMAVVADERSGEPHSQLYGVSIAMPGTDFSYTVEAEFAAGTVPNLVAPTAGTQSVVVL